MTRKTNRRTPIGLERLESRKLLYAHAFFVPTDQFSPAEVRGFNPQPDPPRQASAEVSGIQNRPGGDAVGFSWGV